MLFQLLAYILGVCVEIQLKSRLESGAGVDFGLRLQLSVNLILAFGIRLCSVDSEGVVRKFFKLILQQKKTVLKVN